MGKCTSYEFYLADQNPFDHDNDGVTDEDSDGSGAGRFDEDDDNDGRIDQFTWPCDFDSDGLKDYFDPDDDNDNVPDVEDSHPYDASITTSNAAAGNLFDAPITWDFVNYRDYSGGVNYETWEAAELTQMVKERVLVEKREVHPLSPTSSMVT